MEFLINGFILLDIMLAILLLVVSMAQLDRRYASRVRAEYDRKSVLRGGQRDHR